MALRPLDVLRSPAYLLASFPLGVAYFAFVVGAASAGVSLLVFVVGVFVLAGGVAVARRLAVADARLAARLYDTPVPDLASPCVDGGLLATARAELLCPDSYRATGYLLTRFAVGVAGFAAVVTWLATAAALLATPLVYDRPDVSVGVAGAWTVDTLPMALGAACVGLAVAVAGAVAVAAAGRAAAVASVRLLAPAR
ncbi:sensor domain-containing protein [Halobacterium jilantaiense]|uniref:Putative sensor n=1 Tax=Halobacterium jilantaiense TaxID=355548 RepID=A0A1I0PT22_9EURY|nr:sensor domain-containing protein [Halobacterium jilantaiense]SEW17556.1 Putative sensor [Halobacterium jilantaiense]